MENASKALLVAATVLIVIMLILVGIKVLNSTKDSSKDAQTVGNSIELSTSSAKIKATLAMINYKDDAEFKAFIDTNYGNKRTLTKNEVIELCEIVMERTRILYNENYVWQTIHLPSSKTRGEVYYDIKNETIHYERLTNQKYYLHWGNNNNSSIAVVIKTVVPNS